jgi:hypothetical protein
MRGILGLGLVVCVGCATDASDNIIEQALDSGNGTSLNGTSLNGTSLNGTSLNGTSLNGTSLNGTSLNGTPIVAVSATGAPLAGTAVVGSTWTGTATNGATVTLRVDSAEQDAAPDSDVWFYGVSYETADGWHPLCGGELAMTVAGVWDGTATYASSATQFTFACRHTSIAKCVELGYKTYLGRASHMASCVRLLRGDFCGTGVAYTVDNVLLDLYDNLGVQSDTESWTPEAEWTPAGARCIHSKTAARFHLAGYAELPCAIPETTRCGRNFGSGALLIDELP